MILCRGRNLDTFCAAAENSFCFLLFIYFLNFKIVFVYFYATTYHTRSCIHKIICLTIEHTNIYNFDSYMEITITGTNPRLFDYTTVDHRLLLLFTLNSPASSIICVNKNPASSSAIASMRCCGRSRSRIHSNYKRKGDQYEYQS